VATWPDFDQGQFDAVLFTRSLHHIHPLDEAVRHAADCLANGGRIIVEDFAYECADEQTLRWFKSAIHLLEAASALVMSDEFLDKVLSKTEALNTWRENHERELHDSVRGERGKVDRRKKSRENREQLRCWNWLQLPTGPSPEKSAGVKAGTRMTPGARIFVRSTSFGCSRRVVRDL